MTGQTWSPFSVSGAWRPQKWLRGGVRDPSVLYRKTLEGPGSKHLTPKSNSCLPHHPWAHVRAGKFWVPAVWGRGGSLPCPCPRATGPAYHQLLPGSCWQPTPRPPLWSPPYVSVQAPCSWMQGCMCGRRPAPGAPGPPQSWCRHGLWAPTACHGGHRPEEAAAWKGRPSGPAPPRRCCHPGSAHRWPPAGAMRRYPWSGPEPCGQASGTLDSGWQLRVLQPQNRGAGGGPRKWERRLGPGLGCP